jgi:hypothetical protein
VKKSLEGGTSGLLSLIHQKHDKGPKAQSLLKIA